LAFFFKTKFYFQNFWKNNAIFWRKYFQTHDIGPRSILSSSIEESVRGILEEDGTVTRGRSEDIRALVRLAKDLEFDDNESFFAKVVFKSKF
jgi:hypothetical protein